MCPICMATLVATVIGLGGAGGATALVAKRLRSSIREQDPPAGGRARPSAADEPLEHQPQRN
jgi:hypothetical protein